jgi:hypothetical protein
MGLSVVGAVVVVHIHGLCNQHEVRSVYVSMLDYQTSRLRWFQHVGLGFIAWELELGLLTMPIKANANQLSHDDSHQHSVHSMLSHFAV